jgi:hypothetical protein
MRPPDGNSQRSRPALATHKYTAWQPAWSAAGGASQRYDGLLITARRAADLRGDRLNPDRDVARAKLDVRRAAERWAERHAHAVTPQMTRCRVLSGVLTAGIKLVARC